MTEPNPLGKGVSTTPARHRPEQGGGHYRGPHKGTLTPTPPQTPGDPVSHTGYPWTTGRTPRVLLRTTAGVRKAVVDSVSSGHPTTTRPESDRCARTTTRGVRTCLLPRLLSVTRHLNQRQVGVTVDTPARCRRVTHLTRDDDRVWVPTREGSFPTNLGPSGQRTNPPSTSLVYRSFLPRPLPTYCLSVPRRETQVLSGGRPFGA